MDFHTFAARKIGCIPSNPVLLRSRVVKWFCHDSVGITVYIVSENMCSFFLLFEGHGSIVECLHLLPAT